MSNLPAGSDNDPRAPWNTRYPDGLTCPNCGSHSVSSEHYVVNKIDWFENGCNDCGEKWDDGPDPDAMKGGPDYGA